MAYELMHIAMALTDTTIVSNGYNVYNEIIDKKCAYYGEVIQHFGQYKNHKLIKQLNKSFSKSANNYLPHLQIGYNSVFSKNDIKRNLYFPFIRRVAYSIKSVNRKALQDFAAASNFKQFYDKHRNLYTFLLQEVQLNANVNKQQAWLEKEFPNTYTNYHIVVSPLMGGTHFTTRFSRKGKNKCFMYVSKFDSDPKQPPSINAAKYTGIVMTEIDHNYVNPISDRYKKEINEIFGEINRPKWANGSASDSYKSGYKVFNEYLTHGVYLLFTSQQLTDYEQQTIEKMRISLMENRRKFIKFGDFYTTLKKIYNQRKAGETMADLYPQIIEWCKAENSK
ncbi:MAG: DUF4932 domain-containing protein [Spirosomataceae bacterium]